MVKLRSPKPLMWVRFLLLLPNLSTRRVINLNLSYYLAYLTEVAEESSIAVMRNAGTTFRPVNYSRTYTTFSGADMTICSGGTAIGEINSYDINEVTSRLVLEFTVFNDWASIENHIQRIHNSEEIIIYYASEQGERMFIHVDGVNILGRRLQDSLDNVVLSVQAEFQFSSMRTLTGRPGMEYAHILPNSLLYLGGNE